MYVNTRGEAKRKQKNVKSSGGNKNAMPRCSSVCRENLSPLFIMHQSGCIKFMWKSDKFLTLLALLRQPENFASVTFLLQKSLTVSETGLSFPSLTHFLFEIYFLVCACQALGKTRLSNRQVEQTKWAFPQINGDQSLHFDWMAKWKQQLKVYLMPISSREVLKPKYWGTHRRVLACMLFILNLSEAWC